MISETGCDFNHQNLTVMSNFYILVFLTINNHTLVKIHIYYTTLISLYKKNNWNRNIRRNIYVNSTKIYPTYSWSLRSHWHFWESKHCKSVCKCDGDNGSLVTLCFSYILNFTAIQEKSKRVQRNKLFQLIIKDPKEELL